MVHHLIFRTKTKIKNKKCYFYKWLLWTAFVSAVGISLHKQWKSHSKLVFSFAEDGDQFNTITNNNDFHQRRHQSARNDHKNKHLTENDRRNEQKQQLVNNFTIDENETANNTLGSFAIALSADGKPYVANPTALQSGVYSFLRKVSHNYQKKVWNGTIAANDGSSYWDVLVNYEGQARAGTRTEDVPLSSAYVCAAGPGRGLEEGGGYKLLTEKIRVASYAATSEQHQQLPRLFCAVYTHAGMRDLARTSALSWGYKCDGFLAFSTETIPSLGFVNLQHEGPEEYHNMWQKVRSIWAYIYQHYSDEYDFFHIGGDDMYVIVNNLKQFLATKATARRDTPLHLGQWIRQKGAAYISGGPGYTVNRAALKQFVEKALPICHANAKVSYEDRLFSSCMKSLGILPGDSRDKQTGEQLYHAVSPEHLFTARAATQKSKKNRASFHSRAAAYWETLPHPAGGNKTVGPKHGLEAAATYSVSLHNLYHPTAVARVHAILYPYTCPQDSPLGRGLRLHHNHFYDSGNMADH